jgi:predicted secreted protein
MSKSIDTRVGDQFEVTLQGMPGAGYEWQLQSDTDGVELVSQQRTPSTATMGGPLEQRFVLKPKKPGDYVLQFGLKRAWEPEAESSETYQVHVADTNEPKADAKSSAKQAAAKKKTAKKSSKRSK